LLVQCQLRLEAPEDYYVAYSRANWPSKLSTATYHRGKLYLPKRIREELGLRDGDRMEVTSRDGKLIASPIRRQDPDKFLLRLLEDQEVERAERTGERVAPPWRRRDVYGVEGR